ncbi:hypothetical protein KI387_030215, partial [Taxus chinensis]
EEEHENSGALEHRGRKDPPSQREFECVITPPQPQEGDEEDLNVLQGEHRFKRVFRRTRTQGATPTSMCRSPQLSPQKEANAKRRRKLKLNKEVEEYKESIPTSPTLSKNIEEK